MKTLRSIKPGQKFSDVGGQTFMKVREFINICGYRRHEVICLSTPHTKPLTSVTSAFFTKPGTTLFLRGSDRVIAQSEISNLKS